MCTLNPCIRQQEAEAEGESAAEYSDEAPTEASSAIAEGAPGGARLQRRTQRAVEPTVYEVPVQQAAWQMGLMGLVGLAAGGGLVVMARKLLNVQLPKVQAVSTLSPNIRALNPSKRRIRNCTALICPDGGHAKL